MHVAAKEKAGRGGSGRKWRGEEGSGISVCVIEGINNRLARPNPPTAFRQQTLLPFPLSPYSVPSVTKLYEMTDETHLNHPHVAVGDEDLPAEVAQELLLDQVDLAEVDPTERATDDGPALVRERVVAQELVGDHDRSEEQAVSRGAVVVWVPDVQPMEQHEGGREDGIWKLRPVHRVGDKPGERDLVWGTRITGEHARDLI